MLLNRSGEDLAKIPITLYSTLFLRLNTSKSHCLQNRYNCARLIMQEKRMSVIFGCQRHGCQASFSVALHLIATGKAKVHPLTSTGKKFGVFTTVLRFSLKNFSPHSCSQENRRFDSRARQGKGNHHGGFRPRRQRLSGPSKRISRRCP